MRSFAFKPLEVAKVLAEPHYEANWRFFGGLLGVVSPFSGQGLVVLPPSRVSVSADHIWP